MHRTALITGVGRKRGLGAAIALGLAHDGFDVALNWWHPYDIRRGWGSGPRDTEEISQEIRDMGRRVVLVPGNLAESEVPGRILERCHQELGPIGALVLGHCESDGRTIMETTVKTMDRHYCVNIRASWLLIRAFALQVQAGGAIVALTSDHTEFNLAYGATKGALDRIVVAASAEFAALGIRSNAVNPGPIDTGWMKAEDRLRLSEQTPGGTLGTPESVANLVRFLLSPNGAWINGQRINSNGGFTRASL